MNGLKRLNTLLKCIHFLGFNPLQNCRVVYFITKSRNLTNSAHYSTSAVCSIESDPFESSLNPINPTKILNNFIERTDVFDTAVENGILEEELKPLLSSFASYYSAKWEHYLDIRIILSDIENNHKHITELMPTFLRFAYSKRSNTRSLNITQGIISELVNDYHAKYFQDARHIKRKVFMHTGPTNSGKTYHAMQRYLSAKSGIYAAPLRMLAYEMYVRTNSEGVDCDMITGEEKTYKNNADTPSAHISCTTEMVPTNMALYQVAVIDEIQMISDVQRGGAWTRALYGICCEELHLCGHTGALGIVRKLLAKVGEEVIVHTYDRLTSLTLLPTHLDSDFRMLRPGDCLVSFNRQKLHSNKANIEANTNMKCSIIYGNLPPRVRMEQIRLFNDPNSEYEVAVASDAIGLGVNLNIKRIVFDDLHKINGTGGQLTRISPELVMQISGRAGRYKSLYPDGEVACFHKNHHSLLNRLFSTPIPDISKAILSPPPEIWTQLDYLMPSCDLLQLLDLMVKSLSKNSNFSFFNCRDLVKTNELYKKIGVPSVTKLSLLECFVSLNKPIVLYAAEHLLLMFAEGKVVTYEDVLYIISWPRPPPVYSSDLEIFENISDIFDLYLWLHQRSPLAFPDKMKIQGLQLEIGKTIGKTLSRSCQPEQQDVIYFPDSLYNVDLDKYAQRTLEESL